MVIRNWIGVACLLVVGAALAPNTVGLDDQTSQERLAKVATRWLSMDSERRQELRERFSELKNLEPAERDRMRRLGERLRKIESVLQGNLSEGDRQRLAELGPEQRVAVLQEMAAAEASSEAQALLRRLPAKLRADMDNLPSNERRKLISKTKKGRLDRILAAVSNEPSRLGFSREEAQQLLNLAPNVRRRALLVALKTRALRVLDHSQDVRGVGPRQRERLEQMDPENFARAFVRLTRDRPDLLHKVLPGRVRHKSIQNRLHQALELHPKEYLEFAEELPGVRERKVHHLQRVRVMRILHEDRLASPARLKELAAAPDLEVLRFAARLARRSSPVRRKD